MGERSGSSVRILRVLEVWGGSFVNILYVWEAPGRARFPGFKSKCGSFPKYLRPEASEAVRLAEARVLRVLETRGW